MHSAVELQSPLFIFSLIEDGIKNLLENKQEPRQQLEKSFNSNVPITPCFSCHDILRKKRFLRLTNY